MSCVWKTCLWAKTDLNEWVLESHLAVALKSIDLISTTPIAGYLLMVFSTIIIILFAPLEDQNKPLIKKNKKNIEWLHLEF